MTDYAIAHQLLSDELHRIQRNVRDAQNAYYETLSQADDKEFSYWCAKLDGFYFAYQLFEISSGTRLEDVEPKL